MNYCKLCFDEVPTNETFCEVCSKVMELESVFVVEEKTDEDDNYLNHGDRNMDSFFYDGWD